MKTILADGRHGNMTPSIPCTGDVVAGDTILFEEGVFGGSFKRPKHLGSRFVTAEVVTDSYGDKKQQHTFTIVVIESSGYRPLAEGVKTTRKGRNIYRNGTLRLPWAAEELREAVLDEKHERGNKARATREDRRCDFAA